jgi:F-type H+-transporting ATPase subunit epsilon
METSTMKFKLLLPTEVFLEEEVTRIVAEAQNGSFCLLPRHIDYVAALTPGLLCYEDTEGSEIFLAVDQGVLVKQEDQVLLSTRNAARGPDLGTLQRTVEEKFMVLDDREKTARSALAKIEASFVRRFLEIQRHG